MANRNKQIAPTPDDLLYPLTKGNGPPIKRSEFLDLTKVMNDLNAEHDARSRAAVRLAPFFHELPPEKTVPWPEYVEDPYARS